MSMVPSRHLVLGFRRRAGAVVAMGVALLAAGACVAGPAPSSTPTPPLDYFATCAVAMDGSQAMIEVKGLDAHLGCEFLESFRDQSQRWHLIPRAFGPIICKRTAGGRTYTIHDADPSDVGNVWCRRTLDGTVALP